MRSFLASGIVFAFIFSLSHICQQQLYCVAVFAFHASASCVSAFCLCAPFCWIPTLCGTPGSAPSQAQDLDPGSWLLAPGSSLLPRGMAKQTSRTYGQMQCKSNMNWGCLTNKGKRLASPFPTVFHLIRSPLLSLGSMLFPLSFPKPYAIVCGEGGERKVFATDECRTNVLSKGENESNGAHATWRCM